MEVTETNLAGVVVIEPKVFGDERGFFLETFQKDRYRDLAGIEEEFVQDNHSRSGKGILRGLHLQKGKPQGKLVRCVSGEVFDVAVDVNPDSPSFGEWFGLYLSAENKKQLYIPPGYAHGFQVVSDFADFEYKCTEYYAPEEEVCLVWNDKTVGIDWPLADPVLSDKDKDGVALHEVL